MRTPERIRSITLQRKTNYPAVIAATLLTAAAGAGLVACGSGSSNSATPANLANITIGAPAGGDAGAIWIAKDAGFFKQNGLNVTINSLIGSSGSNDVAAWMGGAFQFYSIDASTAVVARAAGENIEVIFQQTQGTTLQIAMNPAFAQKHSIPTQSGSTAEATTQIEALKGSHLQLAATNSSSGTYIEGSAVLKKLGLSQGVGCAACDIDWDFVGTTTAMTAGLKAGRLQAIINFPPISTSVTNSVYINIGLVPPASTAAGFYTAVTDSYAKQHPKIVQAMVDSLVEAWAYAKLHPSQSETMNAPFEIASGVTDPAEQVTLWNDVSKFYVTPYPTVSAFNAVLDIALPGSPHTIKYDDLCNPAYVEEAVSLGKQSGVKVSTT